ncbi:hypothetical protein EVAR_75319_1 [Eumeta japonica]|uniref:Uncharacterized protein n=1 Tax=Eumeta variegata TaxID=151549 RepID=A0A4C1Y2U6_EUMVA|nr:hypothetical protein EVAR_75319_1 [Eumeta japonica]
MYGVHPPVTYRRTYRRMDRQTNGFDGTVSVHFCLRNAKNESEYFGTQDAPVGIAKTTRLRLTERMNKAKLFFDYVKLGATTRPQRHLYTRNVHNRKRVFFGRIQNNATVDTTHGCENTQLSTARALACGRARVQQPVGTARGYEGQESEPLLFIMYDGRLISFVLDNVRQ